MNVHAAVYVAAIVAGASCLEWPATVAAHNANRYGKQQPAQKQNRYDNPAWLNGASRAGGGGGWVASPYGGNIMRHFPVSINRYQTMAAGGRQRQNVFSDDYYDADAPNPFDSRPYNRMDYAVVRYPSYGVGASGYYAPVAAAAADLSSPYDATGPSDDDLLYDDAAAAVPPLPPYGYLQAPAIDRRYSAPAPPPSNRHEPAARYPTDNIHKFRKVFLSNPESPSNAFKSTKEQQLYDFWESLINGDLDGLGQRPDDRGGADGDGSQPRRDWLPQQSTRLESETTSATSKLYQHLPTVFQQLQQKQRQQQQQQQQQVLQRQRSPDERTPSASSASSSSSSSPSSSSMSIPRGNLYKQWANGSPLIKRSSATKAIPSVMTSTNDGDDVRQLEKLRADRADVIAAANATTTTERSTTNTANTGLPMADGGQREYMLPRPAGEKSGLESLLEVIAAGGTGENKNEIAAATYKKLRQESKVNKNKRSFVSDETSLAAQLGALRKN